MKTITLSPTVNHLVGLELVEKAGAGAYKASPYLF